jgi:mRNA-degrading endonuclease HigB of HigAB toxin-antitoxin module
MCGFDSCEIIFFEIHLVWWSNLATLLLEFLFLQQQNNFNRNIFHSIPYYLNQSNSWQAMPQRELSSLRHQFIKLRFECLSNNNLKNKSLKKIKDEYLTANLKVTRNNWMISLSHGKEYRIFSYIERREDIFFRKKMIKQCGCWARIQL